MATEFQEHYQSVKGFGFRSGLSGPLFAKIISRRQNLPLADKELNIKIATKADDVSNFFLS